MHYPRFKRAAQKLKKNKATLIKQGDTFFFKENVEAFPVDEKTGEYNENIMRAIYFDSPCEYIKTKKRQGKTYHYFLETGLLYMIIGPFRMLTKEVPTRTSHGENTWS